MRVRRGHVEITRDEWEATPDEMKGTILSEYTPERAMNSFMWSRVLYVGKKMYIEGLNLAIV